MTRYQRIGRRLAYVIAAIGAGLAGSSELFDYKRSLVGLGVPPDPLPHAATIWVAGCFGAYLMFGVYRRPQSD